MRMVLPGMVVGVVAVVVAALLLLVASTAARSATGVAGEWVSPVHGPRTVVRPFEPPTSAWAAGHRGVDLLVRPGATVRSAGSGVVTYAGQIAGVGIVTVSHGSLRATYQPVDPTVQPGQRLRPGDPVGALSPIGSHCRPKACLHWGLLRGDTYLDPLRLLASTRRTRLLPLGPLTVRPAPGGYAAGARGAAGHIPAGTPSSSDVGISMTAGVGALLGAGVSGPRMGLPVGPAQPVDRYVGVDLRGGQ